MKKILSVITSLVFLANSLLYPFAYAYAQEETVTPSPEPTIEATATPEIIPTPIPTPTATPEITPSPEPTIEATPTQSPSPWTFEKVELNKEYQNGGVTLTFTKLPDPAGSIKIEEITLTEDQIKQTGSLSDKAYDITSDMKDGDFTYNLSLPIPESSKGKTVGVKFAEELSNITSAEKVENSLTKTDTSVSVASLDHFTIFVVFDNANYYYANITNAVDGTKYRQAGLSPDGTKIVAVKQVGTSWEIVLMNTDGSGEIRISAGDSGTGDIAQYTNPFWSDNGTAIGFVEVHNANPNKIIRYDIATSTRTYIYEPVAPLDASNPDFLGNSKTTIVFWDGSADLFTWDGTTLTNITNTPDYKEYEPVSNSDGTKIVYWSGETTAEPVNTTHTLSYSGVTWTKDVGFSPIADSYWAYWTTPEATQIALTVMSSKDIYIYDNTGTFVADLSGSGYSGGSEQWNFFGSMPQYPNGKYVITSNAGRGTTPVRDIIIAAPRATLYVSATGSDNNPGTVDAPFKTIQKGVSEVATGGTVNVAAGIYNESQILIDKPLTLQGAGYTTTTIDGGETSTGGLVKITASSGTVTISGFTIQNTNNSDDLGHGINVDNGGVSSVDVKILNNAIKNVGPVGIRVNDANSIQIEGNTISSLYSSTAVIPNGIQVGWPNGSGVTGTIKSNEISGSSWVDYNASLGYEGSTTGAGILVMDATAALGISGNTIHGNNVGIDIEAGSSTTIENNDIHDNAYGVVLYNANPSINTNKIVDNSARGVYRTSFGDLSETLDATNNWWGNATPNFDTIISGSASHDPWYVNSGMTILNTDVAGDTVTAPDGDGDLVLSLGNEGEVDLPNGVTDVVLDNDSGLDLSAGLVGNAVILNSGTPGEDVVLTNADLPDFNVSIPDGTTIQGLDDFDWDGTIMPPTDSPSDGTAPAGFSVGGTVISIGSPDGTLTFDTAVTIVLPGVTGTVGYRPSGSDIWYTITNVCTGTYENPTGAVYPGECAINNGTDTKIVTFHFTSFGNLNPDICANIDGFQGSVPDGMHLDASGKNCVNWGGSGPAPRNDEGASNGQVAGVSTLASNYQYNQTSNSFSGDQQPTTNEEVLGENTESEKTKTPEVKGTDTKDWNARNIALISFGSALIILALLLLWRKYKK